MIKTFYRFISKFDHYGTCDKCGISWKYVEPGPSITYNVRDNGCERAMFSVCESAMFPVCESCWEELNVMKLLGIFYNRWCNIWERDRDRETFKTALFFIQSQKREEEEREQE